MGAVTFDKIENARLVFQGLRVFRYRIATITNVTSTIPSVVLESALNDLASAGAFWGSGYPFNPLWRLQDIEIFGISGNTCKAILRYSTIEWGQSIFLVRDNSYMTSVSTQLLLGPAKVPLRVSYTDPGGTNSIPADSITQSVLKGMRSIQITQISFGAVPVGPRNYFGYVCNDVFLGATNPANGTGEGMWLLTKFSSELSRWQNAYTVDAEITTKVDEDWSSWGTLQSRSTGKYADTTTTLAAAMALPYTYGYIYPYGNPLAGGVGWDSGLLRAGHYQMTSFSTLFPGLTGIVSLSPPGLS